jgi:hypothetical protein
LDNFLAWLDVSSVEEARRLPSQALINANFVLVASRPYGAGVLGPVSTNLHYLLLLTVIAFFGYSPDYTSLR